jgi:hypothetical protein
MKSRWLITLPAVLVMHCTVSSGGAFFSLKIKNKDFHAWNIFQPPGCHTSISSDVLGNSFPYSIIKRLIIDTKGSPVRAFS